MARKQTTRCPPFLKELILEYGISGQEAEVKKLIEREIKKFADSTYTDKLGNLIATQNGKKPRVMLAAHMDEVGLVAKNIGDTGRIYFYTVGSVDPVYIVGERVHVVGKPDMCGIVTTPAMNDGDEIGSMPKIEELFVDTGLSRAELKKRGVDIGSFMVLEQEFGVLANTSMMYGKAFDDRLGCYVIAEVARRARKLDIKQEINYVFTVQEEIGLYGAKTSAYKIEPDWALVVDVNSTNEENSIRIAGKGPTITVIDSSTIGNKCINDHIMKICRKKGIPLQVDVSNVGTTDALAISISKEGVPSTSIGIPIKNLHTAVGIASLDDIENCIKLILEVLRNPPMECVK